MRAALAVTLAIVMMAHSHASMLERFIITEKLAAAKALLNETHLSDKVAEEIAPAVTAKINKLDPTPPNGIYCPPGYFSATATGPCEVCGLGYWCPGGFQSTPRRVPCANNATTPTNTSTSPAACGGSGPGNYSIAITNVGPALSTAEQDAVTAAVNKWTSVIVGDTPGIPGPYTIPANSSCGNTRAISLPNGVDDMLILVNFKPFASNSTLGEAGVCSVDGKTYTANIGFVNINSNQVPQMIANGILDDVVLHEFGHAQGFGILWRKAGFWDCGPQDPSSTGNVKDTYFSCSNAITQFNNVGGTPYPTKKVPLQNTGGEGIVNIHWRESVFGNELMSPYVNSVVGTISLLSVVTAGSFADIGHVVDYSACDPYTLPGTTPAGDQAKQAGAYNLGDDVVVVDITVTGADAAGGAVVERVIKPADILPPLKALDGGA